MKKKKNYKELKERCDISKVVSALNLQTVKKGDAFFIQCPSPSHHDTHITNCYFKEGWNNVYCMACNTAIKAIDLIMYTTGWSYGDSIDYLAYLEGYTEDDVVLKKELNTLKYPYRIMLPIHESIQKEFIQKEIPKGYKYSKKNRTTYILEKEIFLNWKDFISEKEMKEMKKQKL